jgi:hypothetical protein
MKLPLPPINYDARQESQRNLLLEQADVQNRKRNQDLEIAGAEKFILSSPNGTRYSITVTNAGVLQTTAL